MESDTLFANQLCCSFFPFPLPEGVRRVKSLARNSSYFRQLAQKMGFIVYGNNASPIVPVLVFHPAKTVATSRLFKERGVAVVVVSYPATRIVESRVRVCLSASHTRKDMDHTLNALDEVGNILMLKYSQRFKAQSFKDLKEFADELWEKLS
eukprot:m.59212 g.59212  ORF g.59212 m.59212 type:complete len:152 (+) comp11313_c0_seq3:268-723(+)